MTRNLRRQGELLCRALAPRDLMDLPVYILPVSRRPNSLGGQSQCIGYTSPSLDLHLQDFVDEWRGRGVCMVIHDLYLEQTSGMVFESDYFGVVLHELAHVLERPEPYRERTLRTAAQQRQIRREAVAVAEVVSQTGVPADMDALPPWTQHEEPFQRMAFHLWHRAEQFRLVRHPSQIVDSESYKLSPAIDYAEAFRSEAKRLANASFRQIRALPYPEAFMKLWTSDTSRWFASTRRRERTSA